MSRAECLRNYTQSPFLTDWHNLLIVTNADLSSGQGIANAYSGNWTTIRGLPEWPCSGAAAILDVVGTTSEQHALAAPLGASIMFTLVDEMLANATTVAHISHCDLAGMINDEPSWKLGLADCYNTTDQSKVVEVQYCLAESVDASCAILINTNLLLIVIICNAIKILCLGTTTCIRGFAPLVTIGDAIESFLNDPEQETARAGPISASDVRKHRLASRKHVGYQRSKRAGRRRANVVSRSRWVVCTVTCVVLLVAGLLLFFIKVGIVDTGWTFGTFNSNNVLQFSLGLSLNANVVLANTPQVAVSLAYIFYNNIITCMVMAGEFTRFASTRKSLRVSRPAGTQRSIYWLTVPYKWSIPMLSAAAILHWLIARSLFFIKIDVKDPQGNLLNSAGVAGDDDYASGITGCVHSPGAALYALALWAAFITVLIFYSQTLLDLGIPVVGSCSKALGAASHCPRTDVNAATLPLQYGIFAEDDDGITHEKVGFSSESVLPHNKILPYYEYDTGEPGLEAVSKSDHIAEFLWGPGPRIQRRIQEAKYAQRRHPQIRAGGNAQSDQVHLLKSQQARRELEEDFTQRNGPYDRSRQVSSVNSQDEVELLPISPPSVEYSRHGDFYAPTTQAGIPAVTRDLFDRSPERDEHTGRSTVQYDGSQFLQHRGTSSRGAELGTIDGYSDRSRQASRVQVQGDVELLSIHSPPAEGSGQGNTSASTGMRGPLDHFVIVDGQRVCIHEWQKDLGNAMLLLLWRCVGHWIILSLLTASVCITIGKIEELFHNTTCSRVEEIC